MLGFRFYSTNVKKEFKVEVIVNGICHLFKHYRDDSRSTTLLAEPLIIRQIY